MEPTATEPSAAPDGSASAPLTDDALQQAYKRLQVVSRKLKEKCDTVTEELRASQSRVAELEVAARGASERSALASLLGGGGGGEARVAARVPVADGGGGGARLWVCLTDAEGERADWISEEKLLARAPGFSAAVR